jgi:uncharacterized membrane protein
MRTQLTFFGTEGDRWRCLARAAVAFATLVSLDLTWFAASRPLYESVVTKKPVNYVAAIVVWALLGSAIGMQERPADPLEAGVYGALVGLVVYGVYNATNYAIMSDWPLHVALIDTTWGCIVCASAALVVYAVFHVVFQPSKAPAERGN